MLKNKLKEYAETKGLSEIKNVIGGKQRIYSFISLVELHDASNCICIMDKNKGNKKMFKS